MRLDWTRFRLYSVKESYSEVPRGMAWTAGRMQRSDTVGLIEETDVDGSDQWNSGMDQGSSGWILRGLAGVRRYDVLWASVFAVSSDWACRRSTAVFMSLLFLVGYFSLFD